jgi:hypothetical protein
MKEFSVSLDVVSSAMSLKDVATQLGSEPSGDSHDLGSPRGRRDFWSVTIWRLNSDASQSAPLELHCDRLLFKARAAGVLAKIGTLKNATAVINIVAFFDTLCCTVPIPAICLAAIREYQLGLEVTCYPSEASGEGL